MPPNWHRGRLRAAGEAPASGEQVDVVLRHRHLAVEQILSGTIAEPQAYAQEQDEWVAVLAGRGVLDVDGEEVVLETGDWLFLPAGVVHTVVTTEPGTSWLAVHLYPG